MSGRTESMTSWVPSHVELTSEYREFVLLILVYCATYTYCSFTITALCPRVRGAHEPPAPAQINCVARGNPYSA